MNYPSNWTVRRYNPAHGKGGPKVFTEERRLKNTKLFKVFLAGLDIVEEQIPGYDIGCNVVIDITEGIFQIFIFDPNYPDSWVNLINICHTASWKKFRKRLQEAIDWQEICNAEE